MKRLSDQKLIDAYLSAKKLGLDPNFIKQLESEVKRRSIDIHPDKTDKKG
ncbi:sporulation histidine kinase inhibitor Sda [Bacillus sp. SD088]|nr:sporulation histidine kinase inhibitor Sda [Bacillus sp. SD088]MBO0995026.1 sporulation histidine kinase inhibitor Sda [Bacillus sp. SD088]